MVHFKITLILFSISRRPKVLISIGESFFIKNISAKQAENQIKIRPNKALLWLKLVISKGLLETQLQFNQLKPKFKMRRKQNKLSSMKMMNKKEKRKSMSNRKILMLKLRQRKNKNHSITLTRYLLILFTIWWRLSKYLCFQGRTTIL